MKTKLLAGLMAFGTAATTFAQERFNVYGFMDATYSQRFGYGLNSPLIHEGIIDPNPTFVTGNVNLYFDFTPTENTRALIETNLIAFQTDESEQSERRSQMVYTEDFADLSDPTILDDYQLPAASLGLTAEELGAFGLTPESMITIGTIRQFVGDDVANGVAADVYAGTQAGIQGGASALNEDRPYRREQFHKTIDLERAWIEYQYSDMINFRAGRFITPAGIWNVDHGSPIITTVGQPNQTSFFPIFPERQQGLMVHGTMFIGDNDLAYTGYVSTGRFQDGVGTAVETQQDLALDQHGIGGNLKYKMYALDGISFGLSGFKGTIRQEKRVHSFRSFSGQDVADVALGNEPFDLSDIEAEFIVEKDLDELVGGVDFKLETEGLTFQAEYNYRYVTNNKVTNVNFGTPAQIAPKGATTEYKAFYTLASYRVPLTPTTAVSPYALFEQIKWERPENTDVGLGLFPMEGWNTYMIGLNWAIGPNFIIKNEYAYGQLLTVNPKDNNDGLIDYSVKQGDMDVQTFSTQFSMAF